MRFCVYILYSEKLDRYYIGSTQDIVTRLKKHLTNHKGFTGKAKDWEIKYVDYFETRELALKRERIIKKWKSRKMIKNLISGCN